MNKRNVKKHVSQFTLTLFLLSLSCSSYSQTIIQLHKKNRKAGILQKYDCSYRLLPVSGDAKTIQKIYFGNALSLKDSILTIRSTECNTQTTFNGQKPTIDYHLYNPDSIVNIHLRDLEEIETFRNWFYVLALIAYT